MLAIRITFKKKGRAKYISHLDLNRCMQRALRRAHIPIWRTQGFNPHPYIVFALPLSIFYESEYEIMDARLDGEMPFDEVKSRLCAQMPEGITIIDVKAPVMKLTDIGCADYWIEYEFEGKTKTGLDKMLSDIMSKENLTIEKLTKRRTMEIDVKPYLERSAFRTENEKIIIETELPAGTQENINPSVILSAFEKYSFAPDFEQVKRLRILNAERQLFI